MILWLKIKGKKGDGYQWNQNILMDQVCIELDDNYLKNLNDFVVFLLPASYFPLRTSHFAPRTSHLALRTSHFVPRTSYLALRTSHLALPTFHFKKKGASKKRGPVKIHNL
jgi:hypothetical protein